LYNVNRVSRNVKAKKPKNQTMTIRPGPTPNFKLETWGSGTPHLYRLSFQGQNGSRLDAKVPGVTSRGGEIGKVRDIIDILNDNWSLPGCFDLPV
jgi:hypothetical protein